ncbi:helix-turn-helix domain-containing protein [Marinomonas pollencensis]|uniref:Cro/C1-type helix-turn-helix DNA-binding protein n=1 Tax=Marinomonas pollencensis TaxID=491954 RepID=A0A3E0DBI7_9GAMM|nr:helix-turn-helix transcriptional regulator [Marinomonas pollencensis]REG79352.1 Cro/C1-type helix-turn-helix DNA-binding protein [Marinomonas pollencensis]
MNEDVALNLRLLCSYYKSISEVSQRLGISRSQFNRYLSGRHRPAANTLRRICEFFDIAEHELHLPHQQFQQLVESNPRQITQQGDTKQAHFKQLEERSGSHLDKYLGYYFEYYYSMGNQGKILKSLVCLTKQGDTVVYQRTERLTGQANNEVCHCKYLGMAYYLSDRIFMMDYESLTVNEITQTILYPTFKNRVHWLHGLRMGVSASDERMPCSSRILMEYLGTNIDLRKTLTKCRLYEPQDREIGEHIVDMINNKGSNDHWQFRAKS